MTQNNYFYGATVSYFGRETCRSSAGHILQKKTTFQISVTRLSWRNIGQYSEALSSMPKPFKHTILGGLLSFEIVGGWRRLCVLRKRLTRKSSSKTTYLKVVQDKQSRPDLIPRLWSNIAYLGRLSCLSSAWTTFK
ncbi:hypothetical protein YC2023_011339 [Brassica napus]